MKQRGRGKHVQPDRLSFVVAAIVGSLFLILGISMQLFASDWKVPARWLTPTDSTIMNLYKNGVLYNSKKRTTQQSYDTTYTVFRDTLYTVEYRIFYSGEDSAASWVWEYFQPRTVPSGDGSDTVVIYVIDTSGTDVAVANAKVTIRNKFGSVIAVQYTGTNGYAVFHLDTASGENRYSMYSSKIGYSFPSDTFSVLSDIDSMSLTGYDFIISDASPHTSRVYGYVYDVTGHPLNKAEVTFSLIDAVNNYCDSTITGRFSVTAKTDSFGLFIQDLVFSSCLGDTTDYRVVVTYKGSRTKEKSVTIPDAPTYQVEW